MCVLICMKLYWKNTFIGTITEISGDFPWMSGTFHPLEIDNNMRDFFNFMTDEENGYQEPPFPEDLLDDFNWTIENDKNECKGIYVPAVYLGDSTISWRWR